MYNGSHAAHSSPRQPRRKKSTVALILSLLLVVALSVGGTVAYLTSQQTITNTFSVAGGPVPEIHEEFTGKTKSNVYVENKGDVPCLVRAAVVVNLLDDNGNVIAGTPEYTISFNEGLNEGSWTKLGDYWYYNGVAAPGGATAVLINSCTSDQHISVVINAQTVQADPAQAALDVWGHSFDGSSWS